MPALQTLKIVFTEQGAACRGLLLLRHSYRFFYARYLNGRRHRHGNRLARE